MNCTWVFYSQTLDHFAKGSTPNGNATFEQRLCVYSGFVEGGESAVPPLILFYTGNESPVEEYVNNTGFMWEVGAELGALLIFAEHRYEGGSVPMLPGLPHCMSYATIEQALADYATIIQWVQRSYGTEQTPVPVVAVGGSYGGMLSSWLRFKYPGVVDGAIAASAPIWGFPLTDPPLDGSAIAISRGLSSPGGAPDSCGTNMLAAWPLISELGRSEDGRKMLEESLRLCSPLNSHAAVLALLDAIQGVFFDLAEANYPFPSTYITSAVGPGLYPLPAWPMRVACEGLGDDFGVQLQGDPASVQFNVTVASSALADSNDILAVVGVDWAEAKVVSDGRRLDVDALRKRSRVPDLLSGIAEAWGVWCNVTGELTCLSVAGGCVTGKAQGDSLRRPLSAAGSARPAKLLEARGEQGGDTEDVCSATTSGCWEPVCCNDEMNLVNYLAQGVGNDFFWPPNVDEDYTTASLIGPEGVEDGPCRAREGLNGYPASFDPWSHWLTALFGGLEIRSQSNIIFSNGLLDPWSSAGVYADGVPSPGQYTGSPIQNITADGSLQALILDLGAHHLDLMFMDDNDPNCAYLAREVERDAVLRWAAQAKEKHSNKERHHRGHKRHTRHDPRRRRLSQEDL